MPRLSLQIAFIALQLLALATPSGGQTARVISQPDTLFLQAFEYRCIGPTRGGRVTAVTGVASQPSVFYMGSTGGGVWKTDDYGTTWKNISDGYFASPSIGAIRVAPSNPAVIYAGTGSDGIRSNVIAGKGVYKSENAGKTWKFTGLRETGHIGAIEIHPDNPDIAFAAAIGQAFLPNPERGLYRTKDGGKSWQQVLYIADTVGIVDVEFAPDNPDILYAAAWRVERKPWTIISGGENGGVYRSEDGGDTWKKLYGGLPQAQIGKIDLAVSKAAPSRLYALVEAPEGEGGLYRSDDRGANFELVSTKKELLYRPFYYCNVDADPQDADVVYVSAEGFFKSLNGGKGWSSQRTPHGDNHDLWINPADSKVFIQSNDGGANITTNGGQTWSTQDNQPTAELYQVEFDDRFPYRVYAGQQDNTTIAVPYLPPYPSPGGAQGYWEEIGGCETGPAVPKPGDPDIVYSNCKGRFGVYDRRTGQELQYYIGAANIYGHDPDDLEFRFQRVAPIHVSPHDPNVVYQGSQYLHKTTDGGKTWAIISPDLTARDPATQVVSGGPITRDVTGEEYYSTLYSIRESSLRKGLIWTGANDGPVYVTRDGGKKWENVTPPMAGGGRVDCVEPSRHKEGKAYAAILRYQLGDWRPYIYKTENYGKSWTLLTTGKNGIPADYPTRVVREDPEREGLLYAGTEYGLYISMDDGLNWMAFQQNLPITPVTDLKINRGDLLISTMGRSFWILDDLSGLRQFSQPVAESKAWLFQPRDAVRMRYQGSRKGSIPEYPEPAAVIDYYLKDPAEGEIVLEIFNAKKELIRSFSSHKKPGEPRDEEPDMATGIRTIQVAGQLSTSPGLHRFHWDMRHQGPWDKDAKESDKSGPVAAPGLYAINLTVNGQSLVQTLRILPDPRVIATGVTEEELAAQENLAIRIRDLESRAKILADNIAKKSEKLKERGENSQSRPGAVLSEIETRLVSSKVRYTQPMLIDQIKYLAYMVDQADQLPGKDAFDRYNELKTELENLNLRAEQWLKADETSRD